MEEENLLPIKIRCPQCKTELLLSKAERVQKKVDCPECKSSLDFTESSTAYKYFQYAGFWRRFFAAMIDGLIFPIFVIIAAIPIYYILPSDAIQNIKNSSEVIRSIILYSLNFLYFAFMESKIGGTYGKLIVKIKVTDMNGKRLSFYEALWRNLGKLVSTATLGYGFVMAGFTKQRQTLHDMISECLVIRV
jgi:uncharacterized RDD family membrane protein YckC